MKTRKAILFLTVNIGAVLVFIKWYPKDMMSFRIKKEPISYMYGSEDPLLRNEYLKKQCRLPLMGLVTDLSTHRQTVESRILVDTKYNIGYCNVPRVGSTFWFSAFAILGSNSSSAVSPFSVSEKYNGDVHKKVKVRKFNKLPVQVRHQWYNKNNLFLFVRDPYARLFSAYLDKFFRPNNYYWKAVGRKIVKFTRPTVAKNSSHCGHDVTFTEFLQFFIASETTDNKFISDHHWTPIYKLCSPCHYNYGFIGKTETFLDDTDIILSAYNITEKVAFQHTKNQVIDADLTRKINQHLEDSLAMNSCINTTEVVERLWTVLKSSGYLKQGAKPPKLCQSMDQKTLQDYKVVLFNESMKQYQEAASQGSQQQFRMEAMSSAYKSVPLELLRSVREILLPDFLLFGYDPLPDYIYVGHIGAQI